MRDAPFKILKISSLEESLLAEASSSVGGVALRGALLDTGFFALAFASLSELSLSGRRGLIGARRTGFSSSEDEELESESDDWAFRRTIGFDDAPVEGTFFWRRPSSLLLSPLLLESSLDTVFFLFDAFDLLVVVDLWVGLVRGGASSEAAEESLTPTDSFSFGFLEKAVKPRDYRVVRHNSEMQNTGNRQTSKRTF